MSDRTPATHYLNVSYGIRSWLFTRDHKRIALLYLASVTLMFLVGGSFAAMVRLELLTPAGDLFQADTYNKIFTLHGIVMVFFFLIPGIPAVLGNFLVPMMIGAKDLAFPRLNLLSWYLFNLGALFAVQHRHRRGGHGLDLLHSLQHHLDHHQHRAGGVGNLRHGILVHPDGSQLHRHHP